MHKKKYLRKKEKEKKEAIKTIHSYFTEAASLFKQDTNQSHRIIRKLRRLVLKYRLSLPSLIKRSICKHCHHLLMPGVNVRIRTRKKHGQVVYYCLDCKHFMRFGYRKR